MTSLPEDNECQKIKDGTETLYQCDGVLYRSTYHDDTQVYEIVSQAEEEVEQAQSMLGLSLTSPMASGPAVRELQTLLVGYGYDVGSVDGVFGTATETAVLWLQYDYELEQTGEIDDPTARLLGILPPEEGAEVEASVEEGAEADAAGDETPEATAEDPAEGDAATEDSPSSEEGTASGD
ncbi:putative peptidoglycan binding protein [Shimia isoporae]|uniref:Putative peptidoglycan binding protein n=1 Tax=Shimia isoporae TaxID=647720 RepID=A0A4R1NNI1_9RHOB|nr:putative peptidoglycan binding protein [Shimia isoporae]